MTEPKLPPNPTDPNFRSPREYCAHKRTVRAFARTCAIERMVLVCIDCGLATK